MPIQTHGVNAIIQAYLKGREISQARQDEATRKQEKADALKLAQDQYKQQFEFQKQQADIKNAHEEALMKANQSYRESQLHQSRLQTSLELSKAHETGTQLPQYKPTGNVSGSIPIEPGRATTQQEYASPDANDPSYMAMAPEEKLRQQENIARNVLESKTQAELTVQAPKIAQDNIKFALERRDKQKALDQALQISRERNATTRETAAARIKASGNAGNLSNLAQLAIKNPDIINDPKLMNPTQRAKVLNELAGQGVDFATASQETTLGVAKDALENLDALANDPDFQTGFLAAQGAKITGTPAFAYDAALTQLKAQLTMPELKNLVGLGSMSEREYNALTSTATKLNMGLPDNVTKAELIKLRKGLVTAIDKIEKRTTGGTGKPGLDLSQFEK